MIHPDLSIVPDDAGQAAGRGAAFDANTTLLVNDSSPHLSAYGSVRHRSSDSTVPIIRPRPVETAALAQAVPDLRFVDEGRKISGHAFLKTKGHIEH